LCLTRRLWGGPVGYITDWVRSRAFFARRLRLLARWAPKPFEQAKTPYVTRALPRRGARCAYE